MNKLKDGFKVNEYKSKVLATKCKNKIILKTNDFTIETVEEFPYLESIVSNERSATIDISKRINRKREEQEER